MYFWSNEFGEPIHVHVSKGKPSQNSTKIWLTKSGGCIVANTGSKIPSQDLNHILEIISLNYFKIISKWKEIQGEGNTKFYC
ncbi:MAG: DUF4160 domain-containing protein [Clostridia bacterium]|nr:DUF4160 domain-containing protein [Clostridia bacterium]